jgi:hypothetical protein
MSGVGQRVCCLSSSRGRRCNAMGVFCFGCHGCHGCPCTHARVGTATGTAAAATTTTMALAVSPARRTWTPLYLA